MAVSTLHSPKQYLDKEKLRILTFERFEPANVWHLCDHFILKTVVD